MADPLAMLNEAAGWGFCLALDHPQAIDVAKNKVASATFLKPQGLI